MKTNNGFNRNNGFKGFYQIIVLMAALLLIYQMAGAKKKETPLILKNDSALCFSAGSETAFVYNFSTSAIMVFSEFPIIQFEKEIESPLKLEDWMIEDWMPDENHFENLFITDKESELKLEKWMTDDNYWKVDR